VAHADESGDAFQRMAPELPLLYSLRGFRYCDWLLAPAERAAWRTLLGGAGFQPAPGCAGLFGYAGFSRPLGPPSGASRLEAAPTADDAEPYPWPDSSPAADLAAARRLIADNGYGRRLPELADAEAAILPPAD
jgi:hypothetical protein